MFSLLDLLFPKKSLRGHEGAYITEEETEQLCSHPQFFQKEALKKRGMGALDCVRVASTYSDCPLLRKAVWTFKYRRIPGLAETLADLLVPLVPDSYLPTCLPAYFPDSPTLFCPVPLYFLRRFHRGFNQAERLAFLLSQKTGIPMRNLLFRTRWTGRQTGRSRQQRLRALAGAFRVRGGKRLLLEGGVWDGGGEASVAGTLNLKNTRIILVDDIMTTGATLQECARVLREAGVRHIEGLVVGHG